MVRGVFSIPSCPYTSLTVTLSRQSSTFVAMNLQTKVHSLMFVFTLHVHSVDLGKCIMIASTMILQNAFTAFKVLCICHASLFLLATTDKSGLCGFAFFKNVVLLDSNCT